MSWIEKDKSILFLTANMVFNSEKGKKLQAWSGNSDDYTGHGTIRFYYELDLYDGIDKECTDFSTPANFPNAITHAIKDGKMRGLGMDRGLLTLQACAEHEKAERQAWIEYHKVEKLAWAEYEKIKQQAFWDLFAIPENRNPAWV